ncbi:hypothetical protein [Rhodopseudomonas palustris]
MTRLVNAIAEKLEVALADRNGDLAEVTKDVAPEPVMREIEK